MVAAASLCTVSIGAVRWQSQAWPQFVVVTRATPMSTHSVVVKSRFYPNNWPRLDCIIRSVVSKLQIPTKDTLKRIQRIQTLTITWMGDEAALSLWAVWTAGSPALVAFSGDRAADLFSALVVLWRFTDGRLPGNLQSRAMRRSDGRTSAYATSSFC